MATAALNIQGNITNLQTGTPIQIGPFSVTSSTANGQVQLIQLASGANTITVPTAPATTGVIIVLDPTNTVLTTLKGVTGDTGVTLGKTLPTVICWGSGNAPANFVLTAASSQAGFNTYIQFI